MAEKRLDGRTYVIRVRVAVELQAEDRGRRFYLKQRARGVPLTIDAGACSGAIFGRHKVDPHRCGIEILEISGDFDAPEASHGAAVAAMAATWIAHGADWADEDLGDTRGWRLRRPTDR